MKTLKYCKYCNKPLDIKRRKECQFCDTSCSIKFRTGKSHHHKTSNGCHWKRDMKTMVFWLKGKKLDREKYPNFGRFGPHTEETKRKISLSRSRGLGTTNEKTRERIRFSLQFRPKVFKRDNYTCQECGANKCALQVDHIKSWSEYPELRFDMNNCRTLCDKCHYLKTFRKVMPNNIKCWGQNFSRGGQFDTI